MNLRTTYDPNEPVLPACRVNENPGVGRGRALALLLAAALALGGCGRAGPLEPPPDPNAVAKPADSDPTHVQARHKPPPIKPPDAPFFLDPLL